MIAKGYNATGVQDLANAAGIPKGSFYNYFDSKEFFLKEALLFYYNQMSNSQFDILKDKNSSAKERLTKFFYYSIEMCDLKVGCFLGNITQEICGISENIQNITNTIQQEIMYEIKQILDECILNKEISSEIESEVLSEFIYMSWQGALLRVKASRNKDTLDNFYKILNEVLLK